MKNAHKVARVEQAVTIADARAEAAISELKEIKAILGVKANDSLEAIHAARRSDFQMLPPEGREIRNYRDLAKQLAITLNQKHVDLVGGRDREQTLSKRVSIDHATKLEEIKEYQDSVDQLANS